MAPSVPPAVKALEKKVADLEKRLAAAEARIKELTSKDQGIKFEKDLKITTEKVGKMEIIVAKQAKRVDMLDQQPNQDRVITETMRKLIERVSKLEKSGGR